MIENDDLHDITTRSDIELLVDTFYKKVVKDDKIGYFFNDIVKLDWEQHIPTMYDFWETILLGSIRYKGNPMTKHIELDQKERLGSEHFERWLELWSSTIDRLFTGKKADEAKNRAHQIGSLMKFKIEQARNWS